MGAAGDGFSFHSARRPMDWKVYPDTPISRLPKPLKYPALLLRNVVQFLHRLRHPEPPRVPSQLQLVRTLGRDCLAKVKITALYVIFREKARLGLGRSRRSARRRLHRRRV
jgi:hypothetical protein